MIWSVTAMEPQLGSIAGRGRGYGARPRRRCSATAAASAQYSALPAPPSASGEAFAGGKRKGERLRFWLRMGARTRCRARFSVAGSAKCPLNAQSRWVMKTGKNISMRAPWPGSTSYISKCEKCVLMPFTTRFALFQCQYKHCGVQFIHG